MSEFFCRDPQLGSSRLYVLQHWVIKVEFHRQNGLRPASIEREIASLVALVAKVAMATFAGRKLNCCSLRRCHWMVLEPTIKSRPKVSMPTAIGLFRKSSMPPSLGFLGHLWGSCLEADLLW